AGTAGAANDTPTARPTPIAAAVRNELDLRRQRDVDIAAGGLRVRADLVRLVHEFVGSALLQAGQVADEVRVDAEAALGILTEPALDRHAGRVVEVDLLGACHQTNRAEEACGVAGREELLGVGALAAAASGLGRAGVQIDPAVGRLHVAVAAASGCG